MRLYERRKVMARITEYDEVLKCYKMKQSAPHINLIEEIGKLEDEMENGNAGRECNYYPTDEYCDEWECDNCGTIAGSDEHPFLSGQLFCPGCGYRIIPYEEPEKELAPASDVIIDTRREITYTKALSDIEVGDIIGDFVCIKREEDYCILQQKYNIEDAIYDKKATVESFEESDLANFLKEEYYSSLPEAITERMEGGYFLLYAHDYDPERTDYPYYKDVKNRTKYDKDGYATPYWTASVDRSGYPRIVSTAGQVYLNYAYNAYGLAPACKINL